MRFLVVLLFVSIYNFSLAQINLNAGLIAYYPFNGNANDYSGNNLNGALVNGPTLTTDCLGNPNAAYYFDGIDDYTQDLNNPL